MENLATKIDTQGEGIPVAVFNMLGHKRTDLATVNVSFSDNNAKNMKLIRPDGKAVPIQLIEEDRNSTGCFVRARIAFVARDVPAMGHAVYRLMPLMSPVGDLSAVAAKPLDEPVLVNDLHRIEFDLLGGAIIHIFFDHKMLNDLSHCGFDCGHVVLGLPIAEARIIMPE